MLVVGMRCFVAHLVATQWHLPDETGSLQLSKFSVHRGEVSRNAMVSERDENIVDRPVMTATRRNEIPNGVANAAGTRHSSTIPDSANDLHKPVNL
jgi:hypothetical protein